ncbi:restriction endonuclease subunit S, partial [bacterium]|nr:restriction endonuclease subunit S [bacterium]
QHRIVDKIEELFINLDAGIEALKKVQAQLKRYRQSILKAAVEGRLTEEWREQHKDELEPADKLLDRILKERREKWETEQLTTYKAQSKTPPRKWQENYKQPKPPDTTDLHKLPKDWVWTNLGEITWQIKDGPHYSPKYSNEGIPFITGGNVRPNGIDFKNVKRISRDLHEKLSKRIKPELGDILYSKGGTTGIARVNTYEFEFNVWVHVAVLKLADPLIPFYIQHALNSPFCYMQSQKYTHGVGNQDLGLTRMVNISVPLPPVKEQIQIISIVESFLLLIERFESLLYTELKRAQSLRQSILKRAFEGKLVPQDPNDEPASILLEKIKAEKAKSINTKQLEMF